MKVAIVCRDTRGGVQPYAALAGGLLRAGHEVRAIVPANLAYLFSKVGITTTALAGDSEQNMVAANGIAEMSGRERMILQRKELPRQMRAWTAEVLAACEGADVMTGGVGGMVIALSVAEKLQIPFIETHLQPISAPNTVYPGVLLPHPPKWLGRGGKYLSHLLSDQALWSMFRSVTDEVRHEVLHLDGPTPLIRRRARIYGFSPKVVPMPQGEHRHTTGYWTVPLESNWQPSEDLQRFLRSSGPPLISVGFGSMVGRDPTSLTELIVCAVRKAGLRAVLLGGWGGLAAIQEEDIFYAQDVPHEWLFPQVAAVVHHAGAGTTGAGIRAGVPAVAVPFAVDQPFWASRIAELGVGPSPVPRKSLTIERLADALMLATTDATMCQRAQELGTLVREEKGVESAVAALDAEMASARNSGEVTV